jgi:hypothetical protein
MFIREVKRLIIKNVNPGGSISNDYKIYGYPVALYTDSSLTVKYSDEAVRKDMTVYEKMIPYYISGSYLYYGLYPQTVVTDSALVTALSALTTANSQGYYEYQGYMYAKLSAAPCKAAISSATIPQSSHQAPRITSRWSPSSGGY